MYVHVCVLQCCVRSFTERETDRCMHMYIHIYHWDCTTRQSQTLNGIVLTTIEYEIKLGHTMYM